MLKTRLMGCCVLILCLYAGAGFAQQTSKSKASDKLYEKSGNIQVKNASAVNTPELDFSPAFYQQGFVFVSSRSKNGPVDKKIGTTFYELYYADSDRNGMPLKPDKFSVEINSQKHEGPVAFSRDFNTIYFTRNNLKGDVPQPNSNRQVVMKIYEAQRGRFDWENIKELPFNSDDYTCVHPSIAADGLKMYFSSDMPGGYGGMDLYMVEKKGDTWTKPLNLGKEINTDKNEVFPFIHDGGTLFFASNGHKGSGGLDIFRVDVRDGVAKIVSNLGKPFNSSTDDLGFILHPDGDRGYFASDREGGFGKDDIYYFEAPDGLNGVEAPPVLAATIRVTDSQSGQKLPGAAIRFFESNNDGSLVDNDLYDVELQPATEGSDELVLKLVRKKEKDLGDPSLIADDKGEAPLNLQAGKTYLLLVSKEDYASREVLVDTDTLTAGQPLEIALDPSACLNLNGVVFAADGITRLPNALVRISSSCLPEEAVLRSNVKGEFEYCLPIGCDFDLSAEKEGYHKGVSHVSTVKIRGSRTLNASILLQPDKDNIATGVTPGSSILREPIREGTVIVLENIYYDFNKYAIRAGAARELDALLELMTLYKTMEVEMVSFTDSRGTVEYNLDLSLKRAGSARDYLVRRGIAANRIKAFGYGESQPRNGCVDGVDCTEEEHQYNRRTEVKVTRINEPVKIEYGNKGPETIDNKN